MNILENIKVLRLQKRLSQLDMAEALAISQSAYAQLESGKTEITLNRIEQLAKLFGMTVIELLQYGGETVPQPQIVDNEKVKELEKEVISLKETIDLLNQINEKEKKINEQQKQINEQQKKIEKLKFSELMGVIAVVVGRHPEVANTIKGSRLSKEEIDWVHKLKTELYNADSFEQEFEKIYKND